LVEVLLRELREWVLYDETEGTDIEEAFDARSMMRDGASGDSGALEAPLDVDFVLQTCSSTSETSQTH
jgi:hypothetical protein